MTIRRDNPLPPSRKPEPRDEQHFSGDKRSEHISSGEYSADHRHRDQVASPERHVRPDLPQRGPADDNRLTPRMGFVVDVVEYGQRTTLEQEHVQARLRSLLEGTLADINIEFEVTHHDAGSGDGMAVFLPAGTDPTHALPGLLTATTNRLANDNSRYRDCIRIRMAIGFGLVGHGPLGFTGPLIVDLSRLNDSQPIRQAVHQHPYSDLVVLASNTLLDDVFRSGYLPSHLAPFVLVNVAVKEFSAPAWLWVSPAQSQREQTTRQPSSERPTQPRATPPDHNS